MLIQDIIPPAKKVIKPVGKIIKKHSRNKYISVILAFLLIFQTIAGVFVPFKLSLKTPYVSLEETKAAGENWFATGGTWNYRRQITLSPATPAANYQVKVTLTNAVLTGAQLTGLNANGNDIRFTGSNGTDLQSYWTESWSATGTTVTATIWVKVVTSGESTIYMYYGNSGATAGSDLASTFIRTISGNISSWNFNEGSGGTTADSSGNGNTGTLSGVAWVDGKFGKGLLFDTTDYVSIGTTSISVTAFSVEAWVNPTSIATSYIVSKGASGSINYEMDMTSGGAIEFGWYNSGWRTATSTATLSAGNWYHLVGTFDGSALKMYINAGTPITTNTSGTPPTVGHTAKIGSRYTGASTFPGTMDDVRIYNKALSAAEISDLYNNIGYTTTNYVNNVLVRQYAVSEPTPMVGNEEYFDHYTVTGTATMDAGASQSITITAKTNLGNTYNFSGDKNLIFSGPGQSAGGNNPSCTDKTSADKDFGTATTVAFASGAATCTMKLYKVESVSVDVTDGTVTSTADATYDLDVVVSSPLSGASIQINSNDSYTNSANTTLTLAATSASQMKFSNDNATYSAYEAYGTSKSWDITDAAYGGTSGDGAKTVYVIFKDAYGNEAAAVNDNIVYDTTVPVNSTAAVDAQGAVNDTWQNNKNDPNFTSFTGASDASGIAGYYVYFGTDPAGTSVTWVTSAAYDPFSFAISNTRYLRVIAKDNAGLYADPDGGGTTCTNTNASRPADPDCWTTIFIHKYDIDAPNTPSPISSPASWTNINSFDFSWSDPLDIGGSGTKDYTYRTDAGTGATTTAGTSVNGLTSDADGIKTFYVKANDNAGNSGTEGSANFSYDGIAPTNAGAATDGNGSLDDTWGIVSDPNFTWVAGSDVSSGVKEYDVYWGTSSTGTTVTATVGTNAYNPAAIPANTPYYLRIRTRDNAGNVSAWATKFTMKYSQAASTPTNAVQTANGSPLAFGAWTSDTTPTVGFTLSDPDGDTVGYVGKIDNNSDFLSPEVFYTYSANDLPSGGDYTFTVGQAAGTGTYTNGSEGQTLAEGQYYWKGKAVESHGLVSSEATANGGAVAFGIDTSNPTGTTLGFGTIDTTSIGVNVSGASDAVSGLATSPYYFENTTGVTNSGWQAGTTWSSTPLNPNTQYTFKVTSKDKAGNTEVTATQNKYTLANDPAAPTVNNSAPTALDVNVNVNSNPASTEFAVYKETGATCDGVGGSYIAADGSDNGATSVWQTDAQWAVTTATSLAESTEYSFCVKARNGENTETSFSSAASGTTTISNQAPNAPILVSPASASATSDTTPTLSANYSDPDSGDTGTTEYRIATSAGNCLSGTVVDSGASSATSANDEDTTWTPISSVGSDGTYYWCARNNDGTLTSNWTAMGTFILNTVPTPPPASSGGGGLPPVAYNPPSSPPPTSQLPAGFSVLINNGDVFTSSRIVTLNLNGGPDAKNMAISEDPDFKYANQEMYAGTKNWILSEGDGAKTIYVKFYTQWGQSSKAVSDSIVLDTKTPKIETTPSPSPTPASEIPKSGTGKKKPAPSVSPEEKPPVEVSPSPEPIKTPEPPGQIGTPEPSASPSGSAAPQGSAEAVAQGSKIPSINFDFIKKPITSIYRGAASLAGGIFGGVKGASKKISRAAAQGLGGLKKSAGSAFNSTKSVAGKVLHSVFGGVIAFFNNAKNTMMTFVDGVKTVGKSTGNTVADQFTPLEISRLKANPLSPTSVEITWETNHKATSKANWGLSRVYDQEKQDSTKTKDHSIILTDLKPGTTYHYEVISQDGSSFAYDADRIFYTSEE